VGMGWSLSVYEYEHLGWLLGEVFISICILFVRLRGCIYGVMTLGSELEGLFACLRAGVSR